MEAASGREPRMGTDRGFGFVVGGVLLLFGLRGSILADGGVGAGVLLGVGSLLVILGAVRPRALAPANRAWFRLGLLLGRIMAPVVMALVFLTTVVPTGLLLRLVGKDPLRMRGRTAPTFWIERSATTSFRDQF